MSANTASKAWYLLPTLFLLPGSATLSTATAQGQTMEQEDYLRLNPPETIVTTVNDIRAECEADGYIGLFRLDMHYASANTLAVTGDYLIYPVSAYGEYHSNPYVWKAVDAFKSQGYSLTSTELIGQGSKGNPHKVLVVMEKK